jgi:hypothetical protein
MEGNHINFTARPQCDTENNSVKPVKNNHNSSVVGDRSIPLIYLHANPLFMIHISIKHYYKD